jgi:hypothetical protein
MLPLSKLIFGDRAPGVFAAILWICSMRLMPQWDTSLTVLGTVLFALVTGNGDTYRRWIGGGLIAGMVTLLNPAAILLLFPWAAFLLWKRKLVRREVLIRSAIVLAIIGLSNLPWVIRNYRIWHAPVLRTNFGFTLYSSNNPCARSSLYEEARIGCYKMTHPSGSPYEVRLVQTLGEVEYDRRRNSDAIEWIHSHPQQFRDLTEARFFEFWFTDPGIAPRAAYVLWIITLLSIPGIIRMVRERNAATLFILTVWLLYPLMFYVVVSCDRYRYPILWTSLLPAGYWAAGLLQARRPAATVTMKKKARR